jgi:hypothetical protein
MIRKLENKMTSNDKKTGKMRGNDNINGKTK